MPYKKIIITIYQYTCTRCGYVWTGRGKTHPKNCANKKCKSPYWDKERRPTAPQMKLKEFLDIFTPRGF